MALASYNDLVSEIQDWLNRDDVTAIKCDTFIKLVEQDFFRRLMQIIDREFPMLKTTNMSETRRRA